MNKIIICLSLLLTLSSCSTREAAIIGAVPGRIVGIPLGMAVTAIDETIKTADDVVQANPRYDTSNHLRTAKVKDHKVNNLSNISAYRVDGDVHYYKAEVLIKTKGPAQMQSMQLLESMDVTEFWR